MSNEQLTRRIVFGTPNFKRKCVVCIIVSEGVEQLSDDVSDFIREFEPSLLDKLDLIREKRILDNQDSYRVFAFNGKVKLKIYFEKLTYFKLEQWGIPYPPLPITDNNAFFISVTLLNEDYYENYRNNNGNNWSWSTN